jgi:hypothetical protein
LPPEGCRLLENSPGVLGFEGVSGPDLYSALPPLSRAGLLNILAKSRRTRLSNTRPVLSYFESLVEIRGDRFYVQTPHELREETKNSALAELFFEVNATLHRTKPGFSLAGSWKTPDNYGNLQLTFSTDGTNWMADVDIDDAAGIAHVFQVLRNAFTGPTHPYDIHQILIHHQELDPDYRFVL